MQPPIAQQSARGLALPRLLGTRLAQMASSTDAPADAAGECCICLESLDTKGLGRQWLPCGHAMHELCVRELRRHGASGRCPLCRASHADLTPVQALLDRAGVHCRRKEFEDSVALYTEVLSVEPANAIASCQLGVCYFEGHGVARHPARAMELLEDARRGGYASAAHNLGVFYEQQGDLPKARELYEEARRGGNAQAAHNLGVLYQQQGDLPKARELYEEARRGGNANAAHNLGVLYQQQGDLPKARELYEEARRGGNAQLTIADLVWIQGLTSDAALPLNGCSGQIVSFSESTGRFGVEVHGGLGLKAIRPENLRPVIDQSPQSAPASQVQTNEGLVATMEELSAQAAIEESTVEARGSQDPGSVNAQLSEALVRSSPASSDGPRVLLLAHTNYAIFIGLSLLLSPSVANHPWRALAWRELKRPQRPTTGVTPSRCRGKRMCHRSRSHVSQESRDATRSPIAKAAAERGPSPALLL